jgi:hypothetical protein
MSAILVYGPSGSGKSTAIKTLDPSTTGIICSDSKELPFRGWKNKYITVYEEKDGVRLPSLQKSNYIQTKKPASVLKTLMAWEERPDIRTIVWDTMTHVIMYRFMTDPKTDWDFYKELAKEIYAILDYIQRMTKDIIVIGHNDTKLDPATGNKVDAIRTVGKLLDEKIDIPSLFTMVFTTKIVTNAEGKNEYFFENQTNGFSFAKAPDGMYDSIRIPNDYNFVLQKIHEYNESND